jgi:hypothetical protein
MMSDTGLPTTREMLVGLVPAALLLLILVFILDLIAG